MLLLWKVSYQKWHIGYTRHHLTHISQTSHSLKFNPSVPERNRRYFQCFSLNKNVWMWFKCLFKFIFLWIGLATSQCWTWGNELVPTGRVLQTTFHLLAPGKYEWNLRHVIFKQISVIDGWGICCETSHYLSQCWPRSLSPYGVTVPHWVKPMTSSFVTYIEHRPRNMHTLRALLCYVGWPGPLLLIWFNINPSMDK